MDEKDVARVAAAIVRVIGNHRCNTVFIPHHAPDGTQGDIKLAKAIRHLWQEGQFTLVDRVPIASSLKALTADSQFVISMRYHQLIFALSTGIPAVGIYADEYTKAKLRGSFEALGLKPLLTSTEEVERDLEGLVQQALDAAREFKAAERIHGEAQQSNEPPYRMLAEKIS